MTDGGNDKRDDVRDDATDSRTLDEIEEDENVPSREPASSVPSPDEGLDSGDEDQFKQ